MKSSSQSQVVTRRQMLEFVALGAAGVAAANTFANTSSDANRSVDFPKQVESKNDTAAPFVLSF